MKKGKWLCVGLAVLFAACSLTGCMPEEKEVASPSAAQINPLVAVDSPEVFEEQLSITMTLPKEAKEVSYHVLAGMAAQADFTWKDMTCTYRMSKTDKDISGVYITFESDENIVSKGQEVRLRVGPKKEHLANWYEGSSGMGYVLYTPCCEDTDLFLELIKTLQPDL